LKRYSVTTEREIPAGMGGGYNAKRRALPYGSGPFGRTLVAVSEIPRVSLIT
jgi:hypothetical protein